jgi:hypothetical protein
MHRLLSTVEAGSLDVSGRRTGLRVLQAKCPGVASQETGVLK